MCATTAANRTARLRRPQLACRPVSACVGRVCNAAACSPRLGHSLLSQQRRSAPTHQHLLHGRLGCRRNSSREGRQLVRCAPRWMQTRQEHTLRARLSAPSGHLLCDVRCRRLYHSRRARQAARLANIMHASAHRPCAHPGAYAQTEPGLCDEDARWHTAQQRAACGDRVLGVAARATELTLFPLNSLATQAGSVRRSTLPGASCVHEPRRRPSDRRPWLAARS